MPQVIFYKNLDNKSSIRSTPKQDHSKEGQEHKHGTVILSQFCTYQNSATLKT